ncbi:MAG: WD40/YVTN/BNR-like repeat-containing protein [Haloarculaceae archaeon]
MATHYVALADVLVVVDHGSDGATATESLSSHRLQSVAASPARPDRVFVGTFESGLLRSVDGGETFGRVGRGTIAADAVTSVAVSPHDPAVVWAGTEPSAVYRSGDGGDTWERRPGLTDLPSATRWSFPPRPTTHHVRWIEPDPTAAGRLYVAVEAGALIRTDDGGRTWQDHPAGARRDSHSLATHPRVPGLVYAAAGDGFAVSLDGGDTWAYPQDGLAHRYCWSVVADPGDPDRLVLSSASGPRAAHGSRTAESYVYRRDGDGPWQRVDAGGLPTGTGVTRPVLATTGETGTVVAATNRGLFRSRDAGESWSTVVRWPERARSRACQGLAVVA